MSLDMAKQCSKCREVKPLSHFHRKTKAGDSYTSACKACNNAGTRARVAHEREEMGVEAWRARNREKARRQREEQRTVIDRNGARYCRRCGRNHLTVENTLGCSKGIKPCPGCGRAKPPGAGRKYCDECRDARFAIVTQGQDDRKKARKKAIRIVRREQEGLKPHWRDVPEGIKWCNRCKQLLPLVAFGMTTKRGKKSPAAYCKLCHSAYHHERGLLSRLGVDLSIYETLLELQDGRCGICLLKPRTRRLAIDHDHDTGEIRGLLCTNCNHQVLGGAKDSPDVLRRAVDYLEHPPATHLACRAVVNE